MRFLNHNLFTGDITVNGTTTLSTATGVTRATGDNSTHLATTAFVKAQGYATTAALAGYVPTSRTLTINGTTYDLSANRSWTISTADGYISNVQVVGSTLSFTGVGSAFSGIVDLSTLTPTVRTVYETVKNVSGATILKGTPLAVVAGQTSGNVSDVVPADAADPTKMPAVFIANQNIADEAEGEAVLFGNLTGVDTSLYQSGTTVYVAPGGGWTATKPVHPNLIQNLGVITKQHATNGGGIVTGVGRANALPNLTAGKIWVGSATYPIESTTVHVDEANGRVGIGTTSPGFKLDVNGNIRTQTGYIQGANSNADITIDGNTGSVLRYGNQKVLLNSSDAYIYTANVARLFINNAGNVGIGTTAPTFKFNVVTNAVAGKQNLAAIDRTAQNFVTFTNPQYSTDSSMGLMLRVFPQSDARQGAGIIASGGSNNATTDLDLFVTTSPDGLGGTSYSALKINGLNGNVGIGTTSPGYKLEVYGSARVNNTLWVNNSNGTAVINAYSGGQIGTYLAKSSSATANFTTTGVLYPRGLGFGAIIGQGNTTDIPVNNASWNGGYGGNIGFWSDVHYGVEGGTNSIGFNAVIKGSGNSNSYGFFSDLSGATDGTRYGIYTKGEQQNYFSGNVGIGATSPSYKLEVDSVAQSTVAKFRTSDNNYSTIEVGDTGDVYASVYMQTDSGNGQLFKYGSGWGTESGMVGLYSSNGPIALQAGGSTKVFVASGGNVGIGTTSPTNKFQVANGNMSITSGYSFILADTDTNWRLGRNIIVESGNYLTGSTFQLVAANAASEGWQFVNDDGFTVLEIGAETSARHVWVNAGNLSVGVASPQEKIHVAGNVRIDGGSTAAILQTNNATAAEAGTTYRTFTTADHYAVFVDYVVYDAGRANMRTGTFRAVWSTGDVVYTDVSTVDLGATDNVTLTAAISGANVNLIVTGPADYTLKYNLKVIK